MGQVGRFLRAWSHGDDGGFSYFCPGCGRAHTISTKLGSGWQYNGNPDAPTFRPSVLVTYPGKDADQEGAPPKVCHSFVTDGQIQFLADCTHKLAGQTVPLPELPNYLRD